jgi:hypothetical protein
VEVEDGKFLCGTFSIKDLQDKFAELVPVRSNIVWKTFDDFLGRSIAVGMHEAAFVGGVLDVIMFEELITLKKEIGDFGPVTFKFGGRGLLRHGHFGRGSFRHGEERI